MTEPENGEEKATSEPPPKVASLPPPNPPPRRASIPSIPPPGALPTAPVPVPKGRSRAVLIGVSALTATVVVAGAVALKIFLAPESPLPVPLGRLPEGLTTVLSTDAVTRAALLEMRAEDVPEEARWSEYSRTLCGGHDVMRDLLDVEGAGGADLVAGLLADKEEPKATLACGKAVAQSMNKKSRLYVLTVHAGHAPHTVFASRYDAKDLPDTTKLLKSTKAPDHLEGARCRHEKGEVDAPRNPAVPDEDLEADREARKHPRDPDADCAWAIAKVEHEPLWVVGDMRSLKAFGDDYSPDGKNKLDQAELFEGVLDGLRGSTIEAGHGDDGEALHPLGPVTDDEILDKTSRILRDVNVWGASNTFDGPFEELHLEYHAAKEGDAKDVAEALERYIKELKRELKDNDESASELEDKRAGDAASASASDDASVPGRSKLRAAVRKVRWRALEDAKIDRSGVVVTVDARPKLDASDKAAWKEYADAQKARAKNAAAIIDALIAGTDPSEDDLKALSPKLNAALHPPESVSLDGFGNLKIPGGGKCLPVDATTATCAFAKWDKPATLEKLKAQITKAGFTVTPGASDATLLATKGTSAVVVDIYGTPETGSHVTFSMAPPKAAP